MPQAGPPSTPAVPAAGDADGSHIGKAFHYITRLEYDKFEQRAFVKNGNGTKTVYGYNPLNRRMTLLKAGPWSGAPFQNLGYSYDPVGNITSLENTAPIQGQNLGGPSVQSFMYDDLYRLVHAEGSFRSVEGGQGMDGRYDMTLRYDSIHRITQKDQKAFNKAAGGAEMPEVKGTYLYNYSYGGSQPHAPTQIGNRSFGYDANGNQTGYQTMGGGGPDRNIVWDEENRIQAIKDGGGDPLQSGINYDYSDSGERVVKYHGNNRSLYINQFVSLKHANSNSGHVLSKHVFVGNTRVLTHLGSTPNKGGDGKDHGSSGLGNDDGLDWVRVIVPSAFIYNGAGANGKAGTAVQDDEFSLLDTNSHGTRYKINYQGKVGFIEMADVQIVTAEQTQSILPSKDWIFYYHPDHLGSVGYLTDRQGELHETTLYFPFGETWMEQRRGVQLFPNYAFTGKELDEETGLYYFGARYYDPRTSVWQSVDPAIIDILKPRENLPKLERSMSFSLYTYGNANPLGYSDPDGRDAIPVAFPQYKIQVGKSRVSYLGHAGIILINPDTGYTRYFEYGRYDAEGKGITRSKPVPNVVMDKETGMPTPASMKNLLKAVSKQSGQGTNVSGTYVKNDQFKEMVDYAEQRIAENSDPNRKAYGLFGNNCMGFCKDTLEEGGAKTAVMADPRPNSYIDELQDKHDNRITYDAKKGTLKIEKQKFEIYWQEEK